MCDEKEEEWWGWGARVLLRLAAAALAASPLRVSDVLFVAVRRYYVSSWLCGSSRGRRDPASPHKPSHFSSLCHSDPFSRHNTILPPRNASNGTQEKYPKILMLTLRHILFQNTKL